jgi:hypothetical protein
VFPAHALLLVEERVKEHQAEGLLSQAADVTKVALTVLMLAEADRTSVRVTPRP